MPQKTTPSPSKSGTGLIVEKFCAWPHWPNDFWAV